MEGSWKEVRRKEEDGGGSWRMLEVTHMIWCWIGVGMGIEVSDMIRLDSERGSELLPEMALNGIF